MRAVIEAYIAGGEPVGSKYLTTNNFIPLSSATIRNEMAELEELGYLIQPHTSAGRIPTEKGYRFYVDSLMQSYRLTNGEIRELNNLVRNKVAELDNILERAGRLITSLTNYTSLTVKPKSNSVIIMHYKIMRLSSDSFLMIMITSSETVKTKYIHISRDIDDNGLECLEGALNELMCGIELDLVTMPAIIKLQTQLIDYDSLIAPVMKCIYESASESDSGDLRLEGINRLLQYPEFNNIELLSGMLGILERKTEILDMVSKSDKNMINIFIGNENTLDVMRHTTLIFKTITSGKQTVGAIGVIGPCRMDYAKVVTTVEYMTQSIAGMINEDDENKKI